MADSGRHRSIKASPMSVNAFVPVATYYSRRSTVLKPDLFPMGGDQRADVDDNSEM